MRGPAGEDSVGGRVEIDAAIGGAAVGLHLEGEAGIARAIRVGGGCEYEVGDIGKRDHVSGAHGAAGALATLFPYTTLFRSRQQRIGPARGARIRRIGEAEV